MTIKHHPTGAPAARRAARGAASGLLLVAMAAVAGCENPGTSRFMSIGTAGTGGIYYVLGGALANQMTQLDAERQFTAEVTGGSVENVNRLIEGQLDIAMVLAVSAYEAYNGGEGYPEPATELRAIAPLYPNTTHLLVRGNSGVESVADLAGKRVSVGAAGSGTEQVSRHLLEAAGLTYDDVQARYLSFSESSAALQDGAIDAAIISVGYPAAAVLEATTMGAGHLVPVGEELIQKLADQYPYYTPDEIPGGVYRGMTDPIPTFSTMNWVISRESLPADVVENLLTVFSEGRDDLIRVHEMARQIDLGKLAQPPIPLHPVAEAWMSRGGAAQPAASAPAATGS